MPMRQTLAATSTIGYGFSMSKSTVVNKPPWVQPQIKAAPKIRQIYWCDYWKDARLPEMWKTRPVIVVSYKNTLTGPCRVVPVSTEPWMVRLRGPCHKAAALRQWQRLFRRSHLAQQSAEQWQLRARSKQRPA